MFFNFVFVFQLLLVLHSQAAKSEEEPKLAYYFELVRHGARAPLIGQGFPGTPVGQLTPQGMRARYLLGRYNYHKYKHLFENHLDSVKMISDKYYRTTMSANAELLGMLHEINGNDCPLILRAKQA